MQISRLFEIIYLLLDKKSLTAKELAGHFEVSVRTIYRDIEILSSAGIPLYTSQGKGGGIALLDEYVLDKSVLTESEQNEILFALQSLTAVRNPETAGVLERLSRIFKKNNTHWIEVDLSPWGSSREQKDEFITLKNAILNHHIIHFEYMGPEGGKSKRRVEPLKLLYKVNAWYLKGFCLTRKDLRTFKISRMSHMESTEEPFVERTSITDPEPEQATQDWINVKLRFSIYAAYRIYDEFDENTITKNEDGSFTVSTLLPDNRWLTGYLLSFGKEVEVLEPQKVRDKVEYEAKGILKKSEKRVL